MNFLRRHWFIIALIVLAAAVRFTILALSQTHVHSDEAIIGLMAKHISEGRSFPFYMYGQPYNASAAGEAYFAAVLFKLFGVSVVTLKTAIVLLSLGYLFLFYQMSAVLFDRRVAAFSTIAFALMPSLLKWDFQVRGYSFYFLAIPILVILFWHVANRPNDYISAAFGLVSGLSIWLLELSLTLVAALWLLLLVWRKMSVRQFALAAAGFIAGYAPAIIYNLGSSFANWRTVFLTKTGGGSFDLIVSALTRTANLRHIFLVEMPKLFGPDTVLWYYPEKPWTGLIFYAVAIIAVAAVLLPTTGILARLRAFLAGQPLASDQTKDLILLFLTAACFVPYLLSPIPTASYFFGGLFFLAMLMGRLLGRCFAEDRFGARLTGALVFTAMLVAGVGAMIEVGNRNEIETLSLCDGGEAYCMARIPGADIAAVEQHLLNHEINGAWTTVSFTYPLLFETKETLAISDSFFGWEHNLYPASIPRPEPPRDQPGVFVLESNSPVRAELERRLTETTNTAPLVTQYGALVVIEQKLKE